MGVHVHVCASLKLVLHNQVENPIIDHTTSGITDDYPSQRQVIGVNTYDGVPLNPNPSHCKSERDCQPFLIQTFSTNPNSELPSSFLYKFQFVVLGKVERQTLSSFHHFCCCKTRPTVTGSQNFPQNRNSVSSKSLTRYTIKVDEAAVILEITFAIVDLDLPIRCLSWLGTPFHFSQKNFPFCCFMVALWYLGLFNFAYLKRVNFSVWGSLKPSL